MFEKMRASLINFLHDIMKIKGRSFGEKFEHFWKKIIYYYYYVFAIVDLRKGDPRSKSCLQCLPSQYSPAGILRLLFGVKYSRLNFTKYILAAESTRSFFGRH